MLIQEGAGRGVIGVPACRHIHYLLTLKRFMLLSVFDWRLFSLRFSYFATLRAAGWRLALLNGVCLYGAVYPSVFDGGIALWTIIMVKRLDGSETIKIQQRFGDKESTRDGR